MNITNTQFSLAGVPLDCIRLVCEKELTGATANQLRRDLIRFMEFDFPVFYIDAKDVKLVDLSGINEIIHSHYTLTSANRNMVFVYRQNSVVEKWVNSTGLHKFVTTALIPE